MRNPGLDEAEAGIEIAGKNISNLKYADDTTLMAESEEELKSLLMKVKEESEKVGLSITLIPKPDKDAKKKRKLQANITDEHRCKNP